jgi:hypothetical protein
LECWNDGAILEKWVLGYWSVGLMAIIVLRIKLKMDNIFKKALFPGPDRSYEVFVLLMDVKYYTRIRKL